MIIEIANNYDIKKLTTNAKNIKNAIGKFLRTPTGSMRMPVDVYDVTEKDERPYLFNIYLTDRERLKFVKEI